MKKNLFLTLAICFGTVFSASAQQPSFAKGDNVVSLGVGLGGYLGTGNWNGSGLKKTPLITASFDHCIIDNLFDEKSSIGVGGMVGYKSIKWVDYWRTTYIVLGVRGSFHYALVDKLDTYAGLHMGYDIANTKWIGRDSYPGSSAGAGGFSYAFFLGARYYFTDAIGAFAELGYGYSVINLGVAFKF
ncbi:MAG: hypothetical protein FWG54_06710 [Bacteroidetes bacterium]|nr:hypothetical protein [Bacteroidota bacterium]